LLIDSRPELLNADGEVIIQIHPREETPVELQFLREYDRRQYGSVLLVFYASASAMDAATADDEMDDAMDDEMDDEFEDELDDEVDDESTEKSYLPTNDRANSR
jgi:hypothetical protein